MKDKKLVLAIGMVLIVIVIVLLIALNGRGNGKPQNVTNVGYYDEEIKKKIDDIETGKITGKYESYTYNGAYLSLTQEQRDNIDMVIDYILELINTRNLETIYALMPETYSYTLFRTEDDLNNYLDNNFGGDITVSHFDIVDGSLKIYMQVGDSANEKSVVVANYEDGNVENLTMAFNGFVSITEVQFAYIKEKVDIRCESIIDYDSHSTLMLEIQNNSNQEKTIDFDGTYLIDKKGRGYLNFKAEPNSIVTVPAGKTVRYELDMGSVSRSPNSIQINIDINGTKYSDSLIITYIDYSYDD